VGGVITPLLANIALSGLDEHFTAKWEALGPQWTRAKRRRAGVPAFRLVRYADDFVVMVAGTRDDTDALWDEVSSVLAPMGLRLSEATTRVCHIDEGSTSSGGVSSAAAGEVEPASERSTPIHPRRRWPR
jgi:RNA-directed DNA polymerase